MATEKRAKRNIWAYSQASQPANVRAGTTWWDTTNKIGKTYNGSSWETYTIPIDNYVGSGYTSGGYNSALISTIDKLSFFVVILIPKLTRIVIVYTRNNIKPLFNKTVRQTAYPTK